MLEGSALKLLFLMVEREGLEPSTPAYEEKAPWKALLESIT
jgi:hypothetical protein